MVQYSARADARFWNYPISAVVLLSHPLIVALEANLWLYDSDINQHKADLCTLSGLLIQPSPLLSLIQKHRTATRFGKYVVWVIERATGHAQAATADAARQVIAQLLILYRTGSVPE